MKINPFKKDDYSDVEDLGLSSQVADLNQRTINKDGSFNLLRKGEQVHIYHWLISLSWLKFFLLILLVFTLINGSFALLYYIVGAENIAGFTSRGFVLDIINLFHFSVQTMTTVGYGAMHPEGMVVGIIASTEALVGLLSFGLSTGLIYGRFSNPIAEIRYSKNILFTELNGIPSLQVRIANKLSHDLFEVKAKLIMLHNVKNEEGVWLKKYRNLSLEYDRISFMPMNWTIVHYIDKESPVFGKTMEDLEYERAEFLLIITAYDESFSQTVHSKSSYLYNELIENAMWELTYKTSPSGQRVFDLDKLDNYTRLGDHEK